MLLAMLPDSLTICNVSADIVKPPNKGCTGDNINSAVVSFVERFSSSQRFMIKTIDNFCETI